MDMTPIWKSLYATSSDFRRPGAGFYLVYIEDCRRRKSLLVPTG